MYTRIPCEKNWSLDHKTLYQIKSHGDKLIVGKTLKCHCLYLGGWQSVFPHGRLHNDQCDEHQHIWCLWGEYCLAYETHMKKH